MEGMDECINERQIQSKRGEGEDEVILKKQKIGINNMHEGDIDMMPRPSYAHVMGEGEEERNAQYWDVMHVVANEALHEILPDNIDIVANVEEDEIVEVEMPRREILKAFSMFHERGIICFFTGKNPLVNWVAQWLNAMIGRNSVEDVYKGPRGFFEVIFRTEEQRDRLLSRLPVFYNNNLVYIVPWRPLAEFQDILKQECPIWVEVECKFSFLWPIIQGVMEQLGKVIVAPNAKAYNRYRLCMLWNTTKKRPLWLNIKTEEMRSFRCQLHWGSFAGHCFRCGGLGHFMAECQQTPAVEVTNKSHDDELMPESVLNVNEVLKSKEANVEKGKSVVTLEHNDNDIQERRNELMDEEGSWIKVASKGNHPRYQKDKGYAHHGQERGSSSRDPMGLSHAHNYEQLKGRSKPWQGSQYKQFAKGTKPFNLRFDKNGKINLPLEKQNWKRDNSRGTMVSTNNHRPSVQNAFAVLSDYFGDIPKILAQREHEQAKKQHN